MKTIYWILIGVLILVIGLVWYFRYYIGIVKLPNKFTLKTGTGLNIYTEENKKYYFESGIIMLGTYTKYEISKGKYIEKYKEYLKLTKQNKL